jgi:hypothetical protein
VDLYLFPSFFMAFCFKLAFSLFIPMFA